jgi:hypothetical protein
MLESRRYLELAAVLSWHRVVDHIIKVKPTQAIRPGADGRNLPDFYVFHGLEYRSVEVLSLLPQDTFLARPDYDGKSLLTTGAQQDWSSVISKL